MKPLSKLCVSLSALMALAIIVLAQTQTHQVLGKIDYQALYDAAPGIPTTPAEAGKRAFGPDILAVSDTTALDTFYAPFYKRVEDARDVIKDAVANQSQSMEQISQRSRAQAEDSAIIKRMGGTEKIAGMSDEERQQAAAQAVGGYQQSLAGGPPGAGGGMQALMQRLMSDPEYQARFDKMSKAEQEAELKKYTGNSQAPPPPKGETAAERKARQTTTEATSVRAQQDELGEIIRRMHTGDEEWEKKDAAIVASPGNHKQVREDVNAKIAKLPIIGTGEAGPYVDPVKYDALLRELATRDRARSAWELQQRSALYTQRKTKYKEVAAAYTAWHKRSFTPVSSETTHIMDDSTAEMALKAEQGLIGLSEKLAQYSQEVTRDAANYEQSYQQWMRKPPAKPIVK
jgi:hypothetical protein